VIARASCHASSFPMRFTVIRRCGFFEINEGEALACGIYHRVGFGVFLDLPRSWIPTTH
jgi:hypothetical protein